MASSDPRARRSRSALESALLELIAGSDLAQISVSDLTRRAEVNRSTFYEHYTDVHDLAASACTGLFDELVTSLPFADRRLADEPVPADNPLVPLFSHVARHAALYRSLLGPDGSARVINHLLHRLRASTRANLQLADERLADDHTDGLIAGAILAVIVDWLHDDDRTTSDELAAAVWPHLVATALLHGPPSYADSRSISPRASASNTSSAQLRR
ncbi:TetR/AcrR family transcriptional regulator [Cryptosporangium phraense]|uniref:TetR/AcrR family transcriptional regulator n=1 Tax=Cryptosporangium phraense TaxID=2593070 RepID=UPI00197A7F90|nr:TetR/AcrR family transcriptional regulator [Cryptosporangium phraense]